MHAAIDHRIAAVATGQFGAIHRRQLHALGLSDREIAGRIQRGLLHRIHRCVYVVGHAAFTDHTRWMGAVLAAGPGAALDMYSAARLHRLDRIARRTRRTPISVLVPRKIRPIPGIEVRFTRRLPAHHVTTCEGIPVVSLERLLVNLATHEPASVMCKLLDEAGYRRPLDLDGVRQALRDLRNRGERTSLPEALEMYEHGEAGTESELEELGLAFTRELGVRDPELNVDVAAGAERYRADQTWRPERVIQEIHGPGHARATRVRLDARRKRCFTAAGWTLLEVTDDDLADPVRRRAAGARLVAALTRATGDARPVDAARSAERRGPHGSTT